MVATLIAACFLVTVPQVSVEVPAKVTVAIDPSTAYEGATPTGMISIIREVRQKIDPRTFTLKGIPLRVEFVEEASPASGQLFLGKEESSLIVSKYRFTLPLQPKGLYVLPEIQVKVGTSTVSSVPVTYAIQGVRESNELRLEASVLETGPFYPGQRLHLQYRIFFEQPIELTKEDLPLFHFEGFRNIGAPKIESVPHDRQTVQLITQEVSSFQAGTFHSGASCIEGFIYTKDADGTVKYMPPPLRAIAEPVSVTVVPFPEKGKPSSFTGAIGLFSYSAKVNGSATVRAGEKIDLEIAVWGRGDLDTVTLGDLSRQKGLREAFGLPDTAPTGLIDDSRKTFHVELRARNNEVKEIPPLEFASFDPLMGSYFSFTLPAMPIKVYSESGFATSSRPFVLPIDIQSVLPLKPSDLEALRLDFSHLFMATILVLTALVGQYILRRIITTRRAKARHETSRQLILRAIREKSQGGDRTLAIIEQALLLRLYEIGEVKELPRAPEELFRGGIQGDIRTFLEGVNARRFGGSMVSKEIEECIDEASALYYRLGQTQKGPGALSLSVIFLFSLSSTLMASPSFQDDGYTQYLEGESAKTPALRKKAFNEALSFYLYYEKPSSGGRLFYNIANCYYQLGEGGLAILYYWRAAHLLPRDPYVSQNLAIALKKTGQDPQALTSSSWLLFFHNKLSLYEKELLFLVLFAASGLFASLFLWLPFRAFRAVAVFLLLCAALMISSVTCDAYFSPSEAVVIRASVAQSGPGTYYTRIESDPLVAGQKLRVVGIIGDGGWLKVQLPSGQVGFLRRTEARVI